jgi:hypothetical protein
MNNLFSTTMAFLLNLSFRRLFAFVFFFLFFAKIPFAKTIQKDGLYIVENIIFSEQVVGKFSKDYAIQGAKRKAIQELINEQNINNIALSDIEIDSCISSFFVLEESLPKVSYDYYTIKANFNINKSIFDLLIKNKTLLNEKNIAKEDIEVILKGEEYLADKWQNLSSFLTKNKISFQVDNIIFNQIHLTINQINVKALSNLLSANNFDIVDTGGKVLLK